MPTWMILHEERKNICLTCESMKRGCERGFCGTKEEALDCKKAGCSAPSQATARKEDQRAGEAQAAAHNMRCSALQLLAPKTCAAAHEIGAAARPLNVPRAAAHQGTLQRAPARNNASLPKDAGCSAFWRRLQRAQAQKRALQRVITQAAARV